MKMMRRSIIALLFVALFFGPPVLAGPLDDSAGWFDGLGERVWDMLRSIAASRDDTLGDPVYDPVPAPPTEQPDGQESNEDPIIPYPDPPA